MALLISHLGSSFTSPLFFPSKSHLKIATIRPLHVAASSTDYDIVKVELTDGRDYPIYIGSTFSDDEATALLRSHVHGNRVLLITNDRIAPMYLERYQQLFDGEGIQVDTVVLPDGEEHKTIDCMSTILDRALELGLDRKCTFVALGGGVIGDMVGFASAIYLRGVNFIQVRLIL
jgi:3-dehydroquinate synthase